MLNTGQGLSFDYKYKESNVIVKSQLVKTFVRLIMSLLVLCFKAVPVNKLKNSFFAFGAAFLKSLLKFNNSKLPLPPLLVQAIKEGHIVKIEGLHNTWTFSN